MLLSYNISETQLDTGRKQSSFTYSASIWRPVEGDPIGISKTCFGFRKLESLRHWAACLRDFMFSRFHRTMTSDRQTDGQTHDDSICRANIASCGKQGFCYCKRTAWHAMILFLMLVNWCYVSRGMGARKVSNSNSDFQGHSRVLAMVSLDGLHTISY